MEAESLRPSGEAFTIAAAIREIYSELAERKQLLAQELAGRYFPNRPQHIVALAIVLALLTRSAAQTALLAANIGGDSDSVASIGGAIAGALYPETVNGEWFHVVDRTNRDGIVDMATALAAVRHC